MCEDGLVFKCKHEDYYLKIYPKEENLLRVEIVFLSKKLKKFKIHTLRDHADPKKVIPIYNWLKKEVAEIVFSDGIDIHSCAIISRKQELKLLRSTSYWRDKQYRINVAKAIGRSKRNMIQNQWRLKSDSKKIFKEKGSGYKKVIVDLVTEKIDSLTRKYI